VGESSPSEGPVRARSVRQEAETIAAVSDPIGRTGLRVASHARRYSMIYAPGVLGSASLLRMPTVAQSAKTGAPAAQTTGGAYGGQATGPTADSGAGTATAAPGTASGAGPGVAAPIGKVQVGSGVTRGGFPCSPGVHQLPYSQYAAPCVAAFTGSNGGATWNGFTATTITIAYHHCTDSSGPNAAAVDQESIAAGGETYEDEETHVKQLIAYINRTFEFYGRHIDVQNFPGQSNSPTDPTAGDPAGPECAAAPSSNTTP